MGCRRAARRRIAPRSGIVARRRVTTVAVVRPWRVGAIPVRRARRTVRGIPASGIGGCARASPRWTVVALRARRGHGIRGPIRAAETLRGPARVSGVALRTPSARGSIWAGRGIHRAGWLGTLGSSRGRTIRRKLRLTIGVQSRRSAGGARGAGHCGITRLESRTIHGARRQM